MWDAELKMWKNYYVKHGSTLSLIPVAIAMAQDTGLALVTYTNGDEWATVSVEGRKGFYGLEYNLDKHSKKAI